MPYYCLYSASWLELTTRLLTGKISIPELFYNSHRKLDGTLNCLGSFCSKLLLRIEMKIECSILNVFERFWGIIWSKKNVMVEVEWVASGALNYTYEKFLDLSLDDGTCLEYLIWFFVLIIPGVQMEDNVLKLLTPAREHGATIIRPRAGLK